MAWFLCDSGIPTLVLHDLEAVLAAIATTSPRVVVINTVAGAAEVADVVKTLRTASERLRIIVLHDGKHAESDPYIPADACIHDANDPDTFVSTVRAALEDELPDEEPHAAAEDAAGG
jgi:hypothetical protein